MKLIKDFLRVILVAAISEKLKKPTRQVNANKQKQTVIRKITMLSRVPEPGESVDAEARNFGSLSRAIQASPSLPVQTWAITTTKPVKVQITMVSRKTPMD